MENRAQWQRDAGLRPSTPHQRQCAGRGCRWHDAQHTAEVLDRYSVTFEQFGGYVCQPSGCHRLGCAECDQVCAAGYRRIHGVIHLQDAPVNGLNEGWDAHLLNRYSEIPPLFTGLGFWGGGSQVACNRGWYLWPRCDLCLLWYAGCLCSKYSRRTVFTATVKHNGCRYRWWLAGTAHQGKAGQGYDVEGGALNHLGEH